MELLRDGVDLQAIGGRTLAVGGDAHLFEEAATPAKIRTCLDSNKVSQLPYELPHISSHLLTQSITLIIRK